MLNIEELKKIGKAACRNAIGQDVVEACSDNGFFGYEELDDGGLLCSMGCSLPSAEPTMSLTEGDQWDYYIECYVSSEGVCSEMQHENDMLAI